MKILFVSSGNNKNSISSIVKSQGVSLKNAGAEVDYYAIKGRGLKGYLSNLPHLKKSFRQTRYDIIHAHYSLSAFLVTISLPRVPIVVSLMGSDVKTAFWARVLIKICYLFFWDLIIVKSEKMKRDLNLKSAFVVPNGVDINSFSPQNKGRARIVVNWECNKRYILFLANPNRLEKNYPLAKQSVALLKNESIELKVIYNIEHSKVKDYINAADVLLLTSLWEGSPNVIKEAMSCNCPIVSTDVGDTKWLLQNVNGSFIAESNSQDIAVKLGLALSYNQNHGETNGREKLIHLGLDQKTIALRILSIYMKTLDKSPAK